MKKILTNIGFIAGLCYGLYAFLGEPEITKKEITYFILIGVGVLTISILFHRYKNKCISCGKIGALKKIKTEIVDRISTKIVKTLDNGKQDFVAGEILKINTTKKCMNCGYTVVFKSEKKREI